ncbi:MAG: site-specific integrase [Phycisphaerae bacterium]|nr:site-specific integrase [Phycisphaerae bacterium]
MPRNSVKTASPSQTKVPLYRLHKASGKAVVTLSGRDHYLGTHGSVESRELYQEIVGRWLANGRTLSDDTPRGGLSVAEVLLKYVEHCEQRYAPRRRFHEIMERIKASVKVVRELYGLSLAASFGPKSLSTVRHRMIGSGLTRSTINDRIRIAKAAFKWAVAEEFIPPSVWHGLSSLDGLRAGDSVAKEPKRVKPVPADFIDAVLPFMRPPVQAMVRLQLLCGARPGELCIMRTADLDTTGKVWVYRPPLHKTEHRGIIREVFIGPTGQEILRPWLRSNLSEYIFRPDEDEAVRRAELSAKRRTPLKYGNRPGSNRREQPKRKPGDHYDVHSYRRSVHSACDKADVETKRRLAAAGKEIPEGRLIPRWSLHALRHNFATQVRREHGIETARLLLGHQLGNLSVTERYAERDTAIAHTVMQKIG